MNFMRRIFIRVREIERARNGVYYSTRVPMRSKMTKQSEKKTMANLEGELAAIRAGRANPNVLKVNLNMLKTLCVSLLKN